MMRRPSTRQAFGTDFNKTYPGSIGSNQRLKNDDNVWLRGVSTYCQQTSLHGWQYLDSESGCVRKFFWFLIVFASVVASVVFLVLNTMEYMEATTQTTIDSTTASLKEIKFPAVYVCNVNQVSKSFLRKLSVQDKDEEAQILFDNFLQVRIILNEIDL